MKRYISILSQVSKTKRLELWLQGFAHILDALTLILSLGFLYPSFVLGCARWRMKRDIARHKKEKLAYAKLI